MGVIKKSHSIALRMLFPSVCKVNGCNSGGTDRNTVAVSSPYNNIGSRRDFQRTPCKIVRPLPISDIGPYATSTFRSF